MKNRSFFLILVSLSFLHISNAQSQLYEGNMFYDNTGKVFYYADDGNAYYYPDEVQRQYQRKPQSTYNTISPTKPSLIASKIEDCKQAYMKAQQKAEQDRKEKKYKNLERFTQAKVVDFANDGVMIEDRYKNGRIFIYTNDQEYATGEDFRGDFLYQKVGYYKYRTVMGNTNSIPAYKATEYRVAEIDKERSMDTYLKDKSLPCCINDHGDNRNNPLFGLYVKYDGPSTCMNERGKIGQASFDSIGIRENYLYIPDYTPEEWSKLLNGIDVNKPIVTDEEVAEVQEGMREIFNDINQLLNQ